MTSHIPRHILPDSGAMPARFRLLDDALVEDAATNLVWPRSANLLGYPLTWAEALDAVARWNAEGLLGHADWRLPNRRELRSLIDHGEKQPALPAGHPFREVFLGWYWTGTSKAGQGAYAWNVHFEGGRMFYSRKDEFRLLWPVRGQSAVLPATGQASCFDAAGREVDCFQADGAGADGFEIAAGQDGALRMGAPWPVPRFEVLPAAQGERGVLDRLTGLVWRHPAELDARLFTWEEALRLGQGRGWRLPGINELESLVDAERADPALPPELARLVWPSAMMAGGASGMMAAGAPRLAVAGARGGLPEEAQAGHGAEAAGGPSGNSLGDPPGNSLGNSLGDALGNPPGESSGSPAESRPGSPPEGPPEGPSGSIWPEGFWSATQSGFAPGWAFVLYVRKGAVGVGFKPGREFRAWLVRGAE
jgi:hypothetical protein